MWKTNKINRLDNLTFRHEIKVSKAYKNVSKHKRILAPVVQSAITLMPSSGFSLHFITLFSKIFHMQHALSSFHKRIF